MSSSPDASPRPAVDYARPVTVQHILRELVASEAVETSGVLMKFVIGLPLCLFGPLLITAIAKSIEAKWDGHVLPGFAVSSSAVALVLVPLMFWYERRTRGEFYGEALRGESVERASSRGEYEMRNTTRAWIAFVEIALTGPRLVLEACDAARGRTRCGQAERTLAAEIVADLFEAGRGVPSKSLFKPGRPPRDVVSAVDSLTRLDWVGTSKARDRIWLSSRARAKLSADFVAPS